MCENIYILKMMDPAAPSFCTIYKGYAGTLDDMKIIYSNLEKKFSNDEELYHENLVKQSMGEYFKGNKDAINKGIYGTEPIFVPTNVIDKYKHDIQNQEVIHKNTWDFEYKLRFKKCLAEIIITQNNNNDKYKIFIKFYFNNLERYDDFLNNWKKIDGHIWGNPGVLVIDNTESENITTYTSVYLEDKTFDNLNDAKEYILDKNQINYSTVFNEIFGDG